MSVCLEASEVRPNGLPSVASASPPSPGAGRESRRWEGRGQVTEMLILQELEFEDLCPFNKLNTFLTYGD